MGNVYTGATGMISFENKINVIGNNIANVKSNGYKADNETFSVFEEGVRRMITDKGVTDIGPYESEVHTDDVQTNFDPGLLQVTNRSMDLSLQDQVAADGTKNVSFFEVDNGGTKELTRDGQLELDKNRNLTLMNGAYLLDVNGNHIQIPAGVDISVDKDGNILNKQTGQKIAQLQIRSVNQQDTGYLEKTGGNMFKVVSLSELQRNFGPVSEMLRVFNVNPSLQKILKDPTVLQNAQTTGQINIFQAKPTGMVNQDTLEQSDVDISYELNQLLLAQKGFNANAKAEMTFDAINEKDANLGAK